MDKKEYNQKLAEYNKKIKELQLVAKRATTTTEFTAIEKNVNELLAEKTDLEKKQLDDLMLITKNRVTKKAKREATQQQTKLNHCKYTLGGAVVKQVATFKDKDDEVFKRVLEFLLSDCFRNDYAGYMQNRDAIIAHELAQAEAEELKKQAESEVDIDNDDYVNSDDYLFDDDVPFNDDENDQTTNY